MSFSGNQYPNYADKVITTRGDIIRGDSSGERARLGLGSSTEVLTSDGTDIDWAAAGGAPTTTKGDLSGFSTTAARIPISTNNFSLYGDSTAALGLKWAASPTSTLDATGSMLYASGANTLAKLAAGTQYYNLQQGASVPAWAASPTSVLTTTGDLLASSAANVLTRIAGGASGELLTGNGAGVLPTFQAAAGGGQTFARKVKTADQESSGDSFIDDDDLFVALAANKDYGFLLYAFWNANNTDGSKSTFTVPSGADGEQSSGDWNAGVQNNVTGVTSTVSQVPVHGAKWLPLAGYVTMNSTAGNLQYQFAKNADASPFEITMKRGSFLVVWEEA